MGQEGKISLIKTSEFYNNYIHLKGKPSCAPYFHGDFHVLPTALKSGARDGNQIRLPCGFSTDKNNFSIYRLTLKSVLCMTLNCIGR